MRRLLFEKTGNAIWISHLDLMRLFQRAFKRSGLQLTHTQGYNPRPSVSIALPMSVGVESVCELLDFELDKDIDIKAIPDLLNASLIPGVRVLNAYTDGRKVRDLSLMQVQVTMTYDEGIPDGAVDAISNLFCRESLIIVKTSKKGDTEQDIIPMIRELSAVQESENRIVLNAIICCQNPTLNPMQLTAAIASYLPDLKPDECICRRTEIYDNNQTVFR